MGSVYDYQLEGVAVAGLVWLADFCGLILNYCITIGVTSTRQMHLYWMKALILNQLWCDSSNVLLERQFRGWRKQTPPSSWSSFKTAIPAPFSFACLILSVLLQPITQSQTGQLIIEMQKIPMPYIDNVVLWQTKSQLLWLAQKPHYPHGWQHITMSRKFTDQHKKHS